MLDKQTPDTTDEVVSS